MYHWPVTMANNNHEADFVYERAMPVDPVSSMPIFVNLGSIKLEFKDGIWRDIGASADTAKDT